jgi:hypothetical protein
MSLVPHIENSEKKDHAVPAVTENGMVWKSPTFSTCDDCDSRQTGPPREILLRQFSSNGDTVDAHLIKVAEWKRAHKM